MTDQEFKNKQKKLLRFGDIINKHQSQVPLMFGDIINKHQSQVSLKIGDNLDDVIWSVKIYPKVQQHHEVSTEKHSGKTVEELL